jgi:hypothetical protein
MYWTLAGPAWIIKANGSNGHWAAYIWLDRAAAEFYAQRIHLEWGETSLSAVPLPCSSLVQ